MFNDIKPPGLSLSELANKLVESRIQSQPSAVASLIPKPLPLPPPTPPKDLKSPLTKKWNPAFYSMIRSRLRGVTSQNSKRIRNITEGLTMPDITSVPIGSAKRMEAAVLFIDLENFTTIASQLSNENVLYFLNIIIPEMMRIIKYWKGEVEKNTGDGLMAIFGTETRNSFLIARDAIESAMTMKYVMLNDIQPKLLLDGLPKMDFRIGIDMGYVLISRIGVNNLNFLTVVGDAANRASKLQAYASQNGICLGENFYNNIAPILQPYCEAGTHEAWNWQYTATGAPYRYFHYGCEWPDPKEWVKVRFS